jgi:hypothetical protein
MVSQMERNVIEACRKIAAGQSVALESAVSRDLAQLIKKHVKLSLGAGGGAVCPECGPLRFEVGGVVAGGHLKTCCLAPFLPYSPR